MIAIVNYDMGNIGSLTNALKYLNLEYKVTSDSKTIMSADKLIIPGVGAYRDAINLLEEKNLVDTIKEFAKTNKPILGICLGFQLLFTDSFEFGHYQGLDLISGSITKLEAKGLKVPHMGWNSLEVINDCPLYKGLAKDIYVYFVHSYCAKESSDAASKTLYGMEFVSSVWKNNIYGVQYHPEKSGKVGLEILKNFGSL